MYLFDANSGGRGPKGALYSREPDGCLIEGLGFRYDGDLTSLVCLAANRRGASFSMVFMRCLGTRTSTRIGQLSQGVESAQEARTSITRIVHSIIRVHVSCSAWAVHFIEMILLGEEVVDSVRIRSSQVQSPDLRKS